MILNQERAFKLINQRLKTLSYKKAPLNLYEPIDYIMSLGGKRIRPILTVLAYQLFDDKFDKILNPAISVEVFHNYTLIHDDIMDKAPLRRGKETVHTKWDTNIAILSGDVMFVKAYELLQDIEPNKLKHILQKFNETATLVCEGQQLDMDFESETTVSIDAYLNMIKLKTAVLLAYALYLGGYLGEASKTDCEHLYQLGIHLGIGFQLMDDLLDVFADKEKFGKTVGGDIIANKKTFLLLKAMELANANQKKKINALLLQKENESLKVKEMTDIFEQLNIKITTESEIEKHLAKAHEHLSKINAPMFNKGVIRSLIEQLANRQS